MVDESGENIKNKDLRRKLADMEVGDRGTIVGFDSRELEIELMRVGLVKGDRFRITDKAPFGGPLALILIGTKVAMRLSDARKVEVEAQHG